MQARLQIVLQCRPQPADCESGLSGAGKDFLQRPGFHTEDTLFGGTPLALLLGIQVTRDNSAFGGSGRRLMSIELVASTRPPIELFGRKRLLTNSFQQAESQKRSHCGLTTWSVGRPIKTCESSHE